MIRYHRPRRAASSSLAADIAEAEKRLRRRQLSLEVRTASMARTLRQRMTAPLTLITVGAVGFLIGDLTNCPKPPKSRPQEADPSTASGQPFFETLLDIMRFAIWMHALFPHAFAEQGRPMKSRGSAGPDKTVTH